MTTKFNKKGEAVITLNADETLILRHVLKQFVFNANREDGDNYYYITDGIASCFTISEFNALHDMFYEADSAAHTIINR